MGDWGGRGSGRGFHFATRSIYLVARTLLKVSVQQLIPTAVFHDIFPENVV